MKKLFYFFSLVLALNFPVFGQESVSVHELHKKQFGSQTLHKSLFNEDGNDIIPLQTENTTSLSTVFGYLPDWEYSSARSYLQYNLLTHIACFDFQATSSGGLSNPSYWPWTDVINNAHKNGVKIIMCVTNFTAADIHNIISVDANKQALITNIKNKIKQYSLDGVNIDFEGLSKADRGSLINSFMLELTNSVHADFPGKEVSFAGPIVNWGGWDLLGLAKACDYIFVMGYDFYGAWSETSGPSAPLIGSSSTNNVSLALSSTTYGYGSVLPSYSQKLILGVPYYGNCWKVSSSAAYSQALDHIRSMVFSSAAAEAKTYGLKWDASSRTAWYCYQQGTDWYQVWFDTDSSLGLKYDLAASKKMKGVGMWALGQDGSRTELWNLLKKKVIVSVEEGKNALPSGFSLSQNYPNPFNPTTTINYEVPKSAKVVLSVHDLLGREVAVLVNEEKSAGSYSVTFEGSHMPSGVYFYSLMAEGYTLTKKFILMK
ncbi:MAG: T9SS type A sorting domain-containing protein [Ignavibacteria bacterium]|nr:T9SS type A sorting domain-containing protein [Ignavibacteria bacterium]MCU7505176.1 T9SS type A sorting domain-containing protein [Ignavibacteria bacterium]MCU7518389.1 T9SS type A sorting domain-containing protein [Ignavibacteria bacterium]